MKLFKYLDRHDIAEIGVALGMFVIALGMIFCILIAASSIATQGCTPR
jgi:hypothetical protein